MAVALQCVAWAGKAEVAIKAIMAEMQALQGWHCMAWHTVSVWEWGEGRMI